MQWGFIVLLALPAITFVIWYFASNASMSLTNGDYNCLDAASQYRQGMSEEQGVPMIHDPRPGHEWVGTVDDADLVRVFSVALHRNGNAMRPITTDVDSFSMGKVLEDDQFSATIDGTSFTCTN